MDARQIKPQAVTLHQVLNMKPPEILGMLEEAAGTRMYESKKEAALRTLDKKQVKVEEINKVWHCVAQSFKDKQQPLLYHCYMFCTTTRLCSANSRSVLGGNRGCMYCSCPCSLLLCISATVQPCRYAAHSDQQQHQQHSTQVCAPIGAA